MTDKPMSAEQAVGMAVRLSNETLAARAKLSPQPSMATGDAADRWRKKPVVIEALQWTGANLDAVKSWGAPASILPATNGESLIIGTLEDGPNSEAVHVASLNDWIIKGVVGEFYPCKPDVFETTYELASKPSLSPEMARNSVLMEALKAVENERLESHEQRLRKAHDVNLYDKETGEDAAFMSPLVLGSTFGYLLTYSWAIRDAENAIKALISDHIEGKG